MSEEVTAPGFCPYCGRARTDPASRYCGSCGRSLPESAAAAEQPAGIARRKRPLWSVFLLTVATFSLYFFVYLGLTWAELKRERRDPGMNPVGHMLAQFVPFYGYFRFHAHMRTVDELLAATGATQRVDALRSTIAYIIIGVFSILASLEPTPDRLVFPPIALYGALAAWHQRGLNAYYDRASGGTAAARVHWAEWVVIVLGMVLLFFAVLGTFFVPPE